MMTLEPQTNDPAAYLAPGEAVDFGAGNIVVLAQSLGVLYPAPGDFARAAFMFVRDKIRHSADIANPKTVTCKASDVLAHGEGICFAKSHLLAALLRFNGIPCGFCYQVLRQSDDTNKLGLHGLNAVFLNDRWSRLDARGNKPGVKAGFGLAEAKPAFTADPARGEQDIPVIFAEPVAAVVRALTQNHTFAALWEHLPAGLE